MDKCKICASVLSLVFFLTWTAQAVHIYDPAGQNGMQFGAALSELRNDADQPSSWLGILSGTPGYPGSGTTHGRVYVWFGGSAISLSADLVLAGQNNELFGFAVQRVGDVNGDGWDDFAVGAPGYDGSGTDDGRVYIYYGGNVLDGVADVVLDGADTYVGYSGGQFGFSVSAAGDFDGDGTDDVIVGAPYADAPGLNQGAAFVYFGGGLSSGDSPDVMLAGQVAGDLFGWSVSDGGNFMGGSEDCVVVGAPSHDAFGTEAGAMYVYEGSLSPVAPDSIPDLKAGNGSGSPAYSRFGFAVRGVGRWDGDSYDDIAVGAPYYGQTQIVNPGRIEIFFGGSSPSNSHARYVNGELAWDYFGYSLADAGDVAGSSYADLIVGAPGRDAPQTQAGRAYIYEGGSVSQASAASLTILSATGVGGGPDEADDMYGSAVSAAGDFDGDGELDVMVGAPGGNIANDTPAGYLHLLDSSGTVTPAFLTSWSAAWETAETVLVQFRLAEPPDAVSGLALVRWIAAPDRPTLTSTTELAGDDSAVSVLPDGTWLVTDAPGVLPAGSRVTYELIVTLNDGREVRLQNLAGPPEIEIAVRPELLPATPNPFNPRTTLRFRAPAGSHTVCRVVDLRGRHVATLHAGTATGLWQQTHWDGLTDSGQRVAAGAYIIHVRSGNSSDMRRVILAK